ncbi:MAG: hypothetical protein BM564_08600 [Bacteroidetes bacterium MedPE-SWsnd-G2]|nr:MAG: hypothetical protein BM564_08600 [Bacteroidetes bacterium MedPE-SWsnd-G2]
MERSQQLEFCNTCTKRKLDLSQGVICSLTDRPAQFETECTDFVKDESVNTVIVDEDADLSLEDAKQHFTENDILQLKSEQNFELALITGAIASILGAVLWAAVTVATEYQIGYMAIAIGFLVGYCIRYFGKGIDDKFGYAGAFFALLSCLLGNFLTIIGFVASYEDISYIETFTIIDYSLVPEILAESFSPIDLLFYGLAVYEGYKFSFRKFTEEDIENLKNTKQTQL